MMEITRLDGIGPKRAALFHELGIFSLKDLVWDFPTRYEDRSRIYPVEDLADLGEKTDLVLEVGLTSLGRLIRLKGRQSIQKASFSDDTGKVDVVFHNQAYLGRNLHCGDSFFLYGTYDPEKKRMANPAMVNTRNQEKVETFLGIRPVYRLCKGLSQDLRVKAVHQALDLLEDEDLDPFSPDLIRPLSLPPLLDSFRRIHFPSSKEDLALGLEGVGIRLAILDLLVKSMVKARRVREKAPHMEGKSLQPFFQTLPFDLTPGQGEALDEMVGDLLSPRPANRLLQGDVGSGKTVLAFALAYLTHLNGYQSALMAPTEVLARQHFDKAKALFADLDLPLFLLTGSSSREERAEVEEASRSGVAGLYIGTHTLFQDSLAFSSLALVVTDEQHRFGVNQRSRLQEKAILPNSYVLSATPIPRTLELVAMGELDLTQLKGLPPGRQAVDSFVLDRRYEKRIFAFAEKLAQEGGQTYIICPRIEGGEDDLSLWSVEEVCRRAREYYGDRVTIDALTGPMSGPEKERVMEGFASGKTSILISTTVIEVGVDVPTARLMVVLCADRFGLSQLHQLRGRVGRGKDKSYAVFVFHKPSKTALGRLKFLASTEDGLAIAKKDLALRGGGDPFGESQHGFLPDRLMGLQDLLTRPDHPLFLKAEEALTRTFGPGILEGDPQALKAIKDPLRSVIFDKMEKTAHISRN